MTSTGLGRHNSKPILEWDEVDMEGESAQDSGSLPEQAQGPQSRPDRGAAVEQKEKSTSPWTAMRKIFKR